VLAALWEAKRNAEAGVIGYGMLAAATPPGDGSLLTVPQPGAAGKAGALVKEARGSLIQRR
jgi:hypothetical protein